VKLPLLRLLLIRMLPASASLRRVARTGPSAFLPLTLPLTLTLALSVPLTLSGTRMAVLGGQHDLELVQLVPFLFGALPFRDGLKLLQACAR
jgi:hypothetical protein